MTSKEIFEKRFLEKVIDASEDTIFVFNPQTGKVIIWNKAFRDISGYNDDEIQSLRAPDSYYSERDLKKAKEAIEEIFESGKTTLEMTLITKGGKKILYEYSGTLLQDPDGNMLIVSVGRNITERKEIELKLKESEEKFRVITEQSFMSIMVLQDGLMQYFNDRVPQIIGYSREEIENWGPYEFLKVIHPEDREFVLDQAKKKQAGEKDVIPQYKYRLIRKDKEIRWVENFSKTINYQGRLADLVTSIDITDKIKADQNLKDSEEKYRILFNNAPFAIVLFNIEGKILDCNDATNKITGYSKEELIGNNFRSFNFYVDLKSANLDERLKQTSSGETPKPREILLHRKDGSQFWARSQLEFIQIRDKTFIQAFIHDITEQKESEQKLKISEERYRLISEASASVVWVSDMNLNLTYVSSNSSQILGYTPEEAISIPISSVMTPESLEFSAKIFKEEFRIDKKKDKDLTRSRTYETYQIHKNGSIIPVEITFTFLQDEQGKINGVLGVSRGISDRKKAEDALRESEEIFRTLAEQSFLGIAILQDNVLRYVNNQLAHTFEYTVEEAMNWGPGWFINVIHPEDRKMVAEQAQKKQLGAPDAINKYQFRGIKKNGDIIWLDIFSKTINFKGELADFVTIHDITEQILSSNKLRESQQRLQERVKELNFLFEISKIAEDQNLSSEEFIINTANLIPSSMQFPELTMVNIKFDGIEYKSDNFKITDWKLAHQIKIDGKLLNIEIFYLEDKPFLLEEERLIKELGQRLKNILEKKQSEQRRVNSQRELEKSYQKLRELENIINRSPGVLFLWKNSEGWPVEFVSENVNQFGYTREDFYSGEVLYEEIIHPDDLEKVVEDVNIHSNEDINEFVQEYRIITKSGEVKWLDDRTWIRRDSEGNITHYQGIVIDITDRKKTEKKLKESEEKYRDAYNTANFYKDLFAHDMSNILQVVNSSAELISFNLGESEKSKQIENISDIIKKQVDRGSKLISNVRTLTELDEGSDITKNLINLHEMINNAIKNVEKAYDDRIIKINIDSISEELTVNANDLLLHVFENVIINSVKYNENSTVNLKIKISKDQIEKIDYFKIQFIDNGIGIPDDKKEIIFKPGNRELKGSKGMGLGLSLVNKILKIFNGKIWVEDRFKGDYKKGSNFIILIPILK